MKIYIAAPFFNEQEVAAVAQIEQAIIDGKRHSYFSPRLQDGQERPNLRLPQVREAIFANNWAAIMQADLVVAWLDRLLPDGQSIRRCSSEGGRSPQPLGPALKQPDIGTVWEIGAAYAANKPVIAFSLTEKATALNIMVLCSCWGLVMGWADLRRCMASSGQDMQNYFKNYEGEFLESPAQGRSGKAG